MTATNRVRGGVRGLNSETPAVAIPEPETYWMMALGLIAVGAARRYES